MPLLALINNLESALPPTGTQPQRDPSGSQRTSLFSNPQPHTIIPTCVRSPTERHVCDLPLVTHQPRQRLQLPTLSYATPDAPAEVIREG